MRSLVFLLSLLLALPAEAALRLWYTRPADAYGVSNPWMEYSLPIGNGQLGASIFGGVERDEVQFNEKTLWTGTAHDLGSHYGQYKNFGSVIIRSLNIGDYAYYERELDIERGVASVSFTANGTRHERTYLASHPDGVIAVRYRGAPMDLQISFRPGRDIHASRPTYNKVREGEGKAHFGGRLQSVSYGALLNVTATDGTVEQTDSCLRVTGATEVVLTLSAGTDFGGATPTHSVDKPFQRIMDDHVSDFTSLMGRVRLDIGGESQRPTDRLIDYYNTLTDLDNAEARHLETLYFQYGRYLEISSSRGVDVPSNLQGIWNDKSHAPWNSDIHTNINVQMNYWPAEPTNLSETHMPFLNFIIRNAAGPNWQRVAHRYAHVEHGWTVFTESNIFGGMSTWGNNYFIANAWLCSHLWQHFRYTRDEDFLARAFPAMWSAAQFWMERMIMDTDALYVAPDEYSPEQNDHPKEDGTAHAQQLITHLLSSVSQADDILHVLNTSQRDSLDYFMRSTDNGLRTEPHASGDTILREWKRATYDVSRDPHHRHLSHLMALYPLDQIGPSSPYFQPAVNSLIHRGDSATGWSMGWKVNLWARALDGDHAHIILKNALKHSTRYNIDMRYGGVYYNLYDSHAPFQIDGNMGMTAGIAELLLQSHTDTLQLLPALPSTWATGSIEGLKAIGNFEVSQAWKDGLLTTATVKSVCGLPCPIRYKGIASASVTDAEGREVERQIIDDDTILLPTTAGATYKVTMPSPWRDIKYRPDFSN